MINQEVMYHVSSNRENKISTNRCVENMKENSQMDRRLNQGKSQVTAGSFCMVVRSGACAMIEMKPSSDFDHLTLNSSK